MASFNITGQCRAWTTQALISLPWGLKNGTASLENNLTVYFTRKQKMGYDPMIQHLDISPPETLTYVYTKTYV